MKSKSGKFELSQCENPEDVIFRALAGWDSRLRLKVSFEVTFSYLQGQPSARISSEPLENDQINIYLFESDGYMLEFAYDVFTDDPYGECYSLEEDDLRYFTYEFLECLEFSLHTRQSILYMLKEKSFVSIRNDDDDEPFE